MRIFCPRCRSLVTVPEQASSDLRGAISKAKESNPTAALELSVRQGGLGRVDAKRFVIHLLRRGTSCHKCGAPSRHLIGPSLCDSCRALNLSAMGDRLPEGETFLAITGGEYGLAKIPAVEAFQEHLGIRLKEAKTLADLALDSPRTFLVGPVPVTAARELSQALLTCGIRSEVNA